MRSPARAGAKIRQVEGKEEKVRKMAMIRGAMAMVVCAFAGLAQAERAVPDAIDPRVRSYVAPTRVVWVVR